ncbi:hypothetical protein A1O7_06408 [Cladophialophora yegresii CBS 114405]|uniref:G-patch domain-containing protein n=1 Tax=Cladophialophora yegresii CBS 114405 TaxID=1182544 RepID=W9VTC7_9EURO|nr:uncharacterized protein A1O7_06408 [Cladophialophora yegresii CBS 114405]EXJ58977.1 hypothetical protein A1O7_06408 [Cladophialophora yegresii CBS 114405]
MAYKRSRQAFEADLQKQASPFVLYGTPLPPLDEHTRDDGSFVPVWKQEVTDERGRKRLHGAFTGGFNAGYYNTVGSKEGWAPSAFVSSRQNRTKDAQKALQQRPEDFMDEEDIREAEESRTLDASTEFAGFGTEHDSVRKIAAIDIFRPSGETVGSRLLKRMGWREGNGIGPRVRRAAKLGDNEDGEETGETHLFAPDDVQVISFTRKTDHKGLGYEGELQEKEDSRNGKSRTRKSAPTGHSSDEDTAGPLLGARKKPPSVSKRTGFGVGGLNDDGSEDEDPYSMGPRISYNKTIGGDKKIRTRPKPMASSANPLVTTKPTFISKKLANLKGTLRKCHDGRLPPDGFVLADELDSFGTMSLQDDKYIPPEVPAAWKSSLSPDMETDTKSDFVSTSEAAKASHLTAKARASLLGESQLPGKSVFDFLTLAARDRLVAASGRQNLPAAGNESAPTGHESSKSATEKLQDLVPKLDHQVAQQALQRGMSGWMPYAEDENKRSRYRMYLEIQAGLRPTGHLPPRAEHMRQDDWVLEMQEFARAAEVFKPISGQMASRFTSSTSLPQGQGDTSSEAHAASLLSKAKAKPEDPAEAAAKLGMFGPMTRSVSNFYPSRLLCKRFGVSMPTHTASGDGDAGPAKKRADGPPKPESATTRFRSFASAGYQHDETSEVNRSTAEVLIGQQPIPPTRKEELEDMDAERNEAQEQQRPGQAIFKAIFGSDDEDD